MCLQVWLRAGRADAFQAALGFQAAFCGDWGGGWGGQAGLELGFQAALVGQQGDKPQERMRFVGIGGGVRGRAVHSALAFE